MAPCLHSLQIIFKRSLMLPRILHTFPPYDKAGGSLLNHLPGQMERHKQHIRTVFPYYEPPCVQSCRWRILYVFKTNYVEC